MRLLKFDEFGQLSLSPDLTDNENTKYAILSHTWGADEEEVNFEDITTDDYVHKSGYRKIEFCRNQARSDGLEYFWVDTCCINKSKPPELSEAITSMYRWYQKAEKCYVYLADVSTENEDQNDSSVASWLEAFRRSRWFTRGWTLQELIAPRSVDFFSSNSQFLGSKTSLEQLLQEMTGISVAALRGARLPTFSVPERMSWAANRQTKKEEDKAYSMIGIFDVSLLPNYGEGEEKALTRLQDEILKQRKKRDREEISSAFLSTNKRARLLDNSTSRSANVVDQKVSSYSNPIHGNDHSVRDLLIEQLYFDQIDERLTSLTAAQGNTCSWVLQKPDYSSWYDVEKQTDYGSFLWIKGHPGTGKSTLMKFLFEEAKSRGKYTSSQILLSFFFLARGTVEERSTLGLYRSLLHQLFQKAADMRDSLDWMTTDGAKAIQRDGWNEEALKQSIKHAIVKLGSRSLMIFVDALDECDKNQAAGMIHFFEDICDTARDLQVKLRICLSSRHYPTIEIQNGIEITLEDEIGHAEDIKKYIKLKLKLNKTKQAENLQKDVFERSSGIFLWVVLVVDILNFEYRNNGFSIKKTGQHLNKMPPELNNLFEMILARDRENLERLHLCLQWVLFAARPLKPEELYFAIQIGLDKGSSGRWDRDDVDIEQMKHFVRSSSKGLAEATRSKKNSVVQFIHESVRDFLFGKYGGSSVEASVNFVGNSHETLKTCCTAQINAPIENELNLDSTSQLDAVEGIYIGSTFPFLNYSIRHVLHHADQAQRNGVDQTQLFFDFPLHRWRDFNNTLEKAEVRRYSESVQMPYILAEKNLANLIRIYPETHHCFEVCNERYGLPFFAALATDSTDAVFALLDSQVQNLPSVSPLHDLTKQYCEDKTKWAKFGRQFRFKKGASPIQYAGEYGDEILFQYFIELGQQLSTGKRRDLVLSACRKGHEGVVRYLLTAGKGDGDLPYFEDFEFETALSRAAEEGYKGIVKSLLDTHKIRPDVADIFGRTPLSLAASAGHKDIVELLLATQKVNVDRKDERGYTPLSFAAMDGRKEVVKLLLETNQADINSQDNQGGTPLFWAASGRHTDVVELLLAVQEVEVDWKDATGRTLLSLATEHREGDTIKLLLDTNKVDINSQDAQGRTPLSWAATVGGREVVAMLLSLDKINVNLQDIGGNTPLFHAVVNIREDIVTLLVDSGKADINSKNTDGNTPLLLAAAIGYGSMFSLMINTGKADFSSSNNDGETLLLKAVLGGFESIVEMLLDSGKVDVNSRDRYGHSPLSRAIETGNTKIVQLLFEKGNAEVTEMDIVGYTALGCAVFHQMEKLVEILIAKNPEGVDLRDRYDRTPLSVAVTNGDERIVKLLLATGKIDIHAPNINGQSPLSLAKERHHQGILQLLLEYERRRDASEEEERRHASEAVTPSPLYVESVGDNGEVILSIDG